MKKENDQEESLTIISQTTGSVESGEYLQIYMKQLQKIPLLKREEEVSLARQIRSSKEAILTLCVEVPACVTDIYLLKDLPATELRKLFLAMIDEDDKKDEVNKLVKDLEKLLSNSLGASKKSANEKLVDFLKTMNFTLNDLKRLAKAVATEGTQVQIKELNRHLHLFKISKNKLIESNLRLVFSRAKGYVNKGLSLEDLLQEGNIGLIKAIEKYDVEKGYKFSTYATWWIDQALGRAVADKGRLIRIPVHMIENINKLTKINTTLTQKLGRNPNIDELIESSDLSEDKIRKVKKITIFPTSVEEPTNEAGIPLSEYLVDYDNLDPYQALERKEMAEKVKTLLSKLEPREEKIIRMRFGIGEKKPAILNQISKQFGVSGERIRQIVEESVKKLQVVNEQKNYVTDYKYIQRKSKV